jgi:hypothetical protein
MALSFNLDASSAFLSDLLMIELTSFGIKFLSSQPVIVKNIWGVVNANLDCIVQAELFPVIGRIIHPLDRGDCGEKVAKYNVILGGNSPSAQVDNLGHFTGVL